MTTKTRTGAPLIQAVTGVVSVGCPCGLYPLEQVTHRTSRQAWEAAAKHVALNPTLCRPRMFRETIPAALAARLPR